MDVRDAPYRPVSAARGSSRYVHRNPRSRQPTHCRCARARCRRSRRRLSGLPERSFIRRFTKAAGMTPLDYVHALRLEEAKQMLETTDLPIDAVANEVGYEDASFFGRLFRRETSLTPGQYRLRFGSLRRTLQDKNGDMRRSGSTCPSPHL
ncbi:helix-turn-helix domain-containing protein [Ensifer sp. 22564]|uniref:helix-turn-helix domain-containing protein n=1 Tax=Ensifer sp. 22564 TaxID=3453943 RepID=UPI003F82A34D